MARYVFRMLCSVVMQDLWTANKRHSLGLQKNLRRRATESVQVGVRPTRSHISVIMISFTISVIFRVWLQVKVFFMYV